MKNDTLKNVLLYFAIVILLFLLFLPPALRWFMKEETSDEKKDDVISILSCSNSDGDIISTSYINDKAYNLYYNVRGHFTKNNEESNIILDEEENNLIEDENVEEKEDKEVTIIDELIPYGSFSYNEMDDRTEVTLDLSNEEVFNSLPNYVQGIDLQYDYYLNKGFECTKSVN